MNTPEFEKSFYEVQIGLMCERYSSLFRKWNMRWDSFFSMVSTKLRGNPYKTWIFLFGLEPVLRDCGKIGDRADRVSSLKLNTQKRLMALTKGDDDIRFYINNI